MPAVENSRPNRPRFQIYLAAFLLSVIVICLVLSWWAFENREVRRRQGIAAIEELGGDVYCEASGAFRPAWLRAVFGDDIGMEVVEVTLDHAQFDDAALAPLTSMKRIRRLYLHETDVSDVGLAHLSRLKHLRRLGLRNTQVSDAGLVHLAGLANLECLDLDNTNVSDAGLFHIAGLTRLDTLILRRTQVTDAGVSALQKSLPNTQIDR